MISYSRRPLILAATVLGIGMGGFLDGIVFHQILQLHSTLSAKVPRDTVVGIQINMFWDGVFHLGVWGITALGIGLLWRAKGLLDTRKCDTTLVGSLLLGWGLFNLVEGILNHHLLHLHHVTETKQHVVFDILFLMSGVALVVVGSLIIRRAKR